VGEELDGVGSFEAFVGVREVAADVSFCDGAKEGVFDSVEENVGVGVAEESFVVGDGDAAEDEIAVFY